MFKKQITLVFLCLSFCLTLNFRANAQGFNTGLLQQFNSLSPNLLPGGGPVQYQPTAPLALTGEPGNETSLNFSGGFIPSTPSQMQQQMNGLPPTCLDSFVDRAGVYANQIYGDEGTGIFAASGLAPTPGLVTNSPLAPTPLEGFNADNRIGYGITFSPDNLGLTTGHGSYLPSAWGADEVMVNSMGMPAYPGGEWTQSGPGGPDALFQNIFGGFMSMGSISNMIP